MTSRWTRSATTRPTRPRTSTSPTRTIEPLTEDERTDVEEDLPDLEVFQALLAPSGIRGLVIDCEDCHEPHFFDWALLRANLRHLLDSGRPRVHEPAFDPDPDHYVSWEYARGYTDGVHDTLLEDDERRVEPLGRGEAPRGMLGARTHQPARNAAATAWARSRAPSLRNSRRAWVLTVSSETNSSRPISALLLPSAIPRSTCSSRSVRVTRRRRRAPRPAPRRAAVGRRRAAPARLPPTALAAPRLVARSPGASPAGRSRAGLLGRHRATAERPTGRAAA